jgi:hypothetical protein
MKEKRLKMSKKKILIVACVFMFVSLSSIVMYHVYKEDKQEKGSFASEVTLEDIIDMGKGINSPHDTFMVLSEKFENVNMNKINVVPGKYMTYQIKSGDYVYLDSDPDSKKVTYKEAKILFYDLETKQLDKTLDLMEWITKWKDYQYDGTYYFYSGGTGTIYGEFIFVPSPELGEEKRYKELLTLYVDTETDEVKVIEGTYTVEDFDPFIEEQIELHNQMIEEASDEEYWEIFRLENNFVDYIAQEYNTGKEQKENKECYFSVQKFSTIQDVVTVNLSTASLPKKNKALYERFPELEQYRDQEWRMVRIYLGGYPTKEEIASLFVEEK